MRSRVHHSRDYGSYDAAWYCECEPGEHAEAGYFFDLVYPSHRGGARAENHVGQATYREYLLANPMRAYRLEPNLAELLKSYNDKRRRKLTEPMEE